VEAKRSARCEEEHDVVLAPVNAYPFRNPEQVRETFSTKISDLLRTANAEVPNAAMLDGLLTLGQYIEQVYWKHCESRQQLQGANHVEGKPITSIQINRVTAKDGQDWLNNLPQGLSHKTHLRARAFLSGVLNTALQTNVISGVNPMSATKAGGLSNRPKTLRLNSSRTKDS
jgi:hypothetical protein